MAGRGEEVLRRRRRADGRGRGGVLPRTQHRSGRLHRRRRDRHGSRRGAERGDRRGRRCEPRRADPVRIRRPAQAERGRRGAPPRPRLPRARLQVPPEHPGVLSERESVLPALRGDRGGRSPCALPHRPFGDRLRPAGRRRHPAQVLEPDVRGRRRRRLPRPEDRARPPVLSLAGRGDLGCAAQAAGLHRPVRLVAQVLPAAARPLREHAAAGSRSVRLRLPDDHARPLALRLRAGRLQGRRPAADPEGQRGPSPRIVATRV